jgi:hypothetical protein
VKFPHSEYSIPHVTTGKRQGADSQDLCQQLFVEAVGHGADDHSRHRGFRRDVEKRAQAVGTCFSLFYSLALCRWHKIVFLQAPSKELPFLFSKNI